MVSGDRGVSLVELLVALAISGAVLGSAVHLARQVQLMYATLLHDAAAEQEARVALEWITRTIAAAGASPYGITDASCLPAGGFVPVRIDPDGNGVHDDIRVQADINPPNGLLVGHAGACEETGEDVTITLDRGSSTIMRRDGAGAGATMPATDGVFVNLTFTYLTADRRETVAAEQVAIVQVALTVRSRARNAHTGRFNTSTYRAEARIWTW